MRRCIGLVFVFAAALSGAQTLTEGLGISKVGVGGRTPFPTDALLQQIVAGTWKAPQAGDEVTAPDGSKHAWQPIKANKDGIFEGEPVDSGYVYFSVDSPSDKVVELIAQGDSTAYINGQIRPGDPYQTGYLHLPIRLHQGKNDLLFSCGRGQLHVDLKEPKAPVVLATGDDTLPDLLVGQKLDGWMGIVVENASYKDLTGYRIKTTRPDGKSKSTDLPVIPAMSLRKVPVALLPGEAMQPGEVKYAVELQDKQGKAVDSREVTLRIRQPFDTHKETFLSAIDGSVQYYAVVPAMKPSDENLLVMTLHGAGVEALGQAEAYAPKDWATLVAPTNRRPFGFDWENWGRLDFLEVFGRAKMEFPHDPRRVILTGHSMGGHGTWSIGSTFPGQFAAIGPSAGWISFWTYVGAYKPKDPQDPIESILRRAQDSSDTELFRSNLAAPNVYILHGDADDNVPVTEARAMRTYLESINKKVDYHEEKGAGHWWNMPGPGAECVDWPPMFDLFRRSQMDLSAMHLDFTTVNPAVSPSFRWAVIQQQENSLAPSRITFDPPFANTLSGTTQNVACFSLNYNQPQLWGTGLTVDGQRIPMPNVPDGLSTFRKIDGRWVYAKLPQPTEKNPMRGGPFKQAFQRNMIFVYGTQGTAEENAWAANKARFDAEGFYYRGNGSVDVISDREFNAGRTKNRNVILYGNADTNKAWRDLLKDSPIQVRRGGVNIGGKEYAGNNLACLFLRPRAGTPDGLVGVVTGTGPEGMRLTDRLPYFLSACEYPDWTVFKPNVLLDGPAGVTAAGFFDNQWRMDPQQSAFK